jgi:KDO2-lipid IV(A) lauroyltransferase
MKALGACGVDLVAVDRVRKLVESSTPENLLHLFSETELAGALNAPSRYIHLASRFAAKEACLKLFPRETALGKITFADFSLNKDSFGAPIVMCTANAQAVLDLHQVEHILISLSHTKTHAIAVAFKEKKTIKAAILGHIIYHFLPFRRALILENLRRVYGQNLDDDQITLLAKAHYKHCIGMVLDFCRHQLLPIRHREKRVSVEKTEPVIEALSKQKGAIILTGHFGDFGTAITTVNAFLPETRKRIYVIKRQLWPAWLEVLINNHSHREELGILPKRGRMESILNALDQGHIVVFPFDQHTSGHQSIMVEFFGYPVGTDRSLALIALTSRVPVIPASIRREANGQHVVRFGNPLELIKHPVRDEEIRLNTRLFNQALERMILRQPEQWWWMQRRFRS